MAKTRLRKHDRGRQPNYRAQETISTVFRETNAAPQRNNNRGPGIGLTQNGQEPSRLRLFVRRHEGLARPYRALKRSVLWAARRGFITWVLGPVIATVVVRVILGLFGFTASSGIQDILATVAILSFTIIVVQFFRAASIGQWMNVLHEIEKVSRDKQRPFLEKLVTARLNEIRDTVDSIIRGDFRPDPPESMSAYFSNFFADGGSVYTGVDSHLPTDFLSRYDWYLKVHESHLQQVRDRGGEVVHQRIMVASRNQLTNDYLADSPRYLEFVRWHKRNDVALSWVDAERIGQIRRQFGIDEKIDIGLWEQFAVAFINDEADVPCLSMRFPADTERDLPWQICVDYVDAVRAAAEPLGEGPPGLEVVDEDLAKAWEAYVDSRARMDARGRFGRFLKDVLTERQLVLDAAAGIGCESVLLLKAGFSVISNEVDANLSVVAERFAHERGVLLDLRNYLWEQLAQELPGALRFDAVLCLGNSLCLVDTEERRLECLGSFSDVTRPGGLLVIDERNYRYMLEHRDDILSDPLSFRPAAGGDVMYSGERVRGVPVRISDSKVSWRLFDRSPVKHGRDIASHYRGRKELMLHPFAYGEMMRILKESGYSSIRVFADLTDTGCVGEMPEYATVESADFFTYVAVRT